MRSFSALAAVASTAALVALSACSKPEVAADPVRAVRTLTVASDSAGGSFDYAAEIRARTETRLSFRVAGKLVQRHVNLGDKVRAGQTLARLDPQDLKLGQDNARASLAAAQASLDQSQADFNRYKELRDKEFISSAELERRETTLKSAQAQMQQARAQVSVQLNQTSYAVLTADVSGVVTGIDAEPGSVLTAGSPVLRLAQDGARDVVFSVPEDKLELVRSLANAPGSFSVVLWGDNAVPLPATLREVSASADPVTRTFLVKADIGTAAGSAVRLGQTATVHVELPRTAGVTKLPLSALKEEQGRSIVWVVDRNTMTVRPQPVQIAGADGNDAVISSGLSAGQWVVTAGVHVLNPGQKVKLYGAPTTTAPTATPGMAARAGSAPLPSVASASAGK